jgi:hypothetical protein
VDFLLDFADHIAREAPEAELVQLPKDGGEKSLRQRK